jgi:hypothetical protein
LRVQTIHPDVMVTAGAQVKREPTRLADNVASRVFMAGVLVERSDARCIPALLR